MAAVTQGWLLNGRVSYRQFSTGHRSGFEPVFLAAAVPARPGELVLDAGTGAGAGLLCLASRVPGITGIGAEIDPALAGLAAANFAGNGLNSVFPVQCDVTRLPFGPGFDHVMANPPWHDAAGTASPDAKRALAHRAAPGLLTGWISALAQALKPRGSLTIIIPGTSFPAAAASLAANDCGGITLYPLFSRAGEAAKHVIITARRHSHAPAVIRPGLIVHDADGISPAAQAILRDRQPIG